VIASRNLLLQLFARGELACALKASEMIALAGNVVCRADLFLFAKLGQERCRLGAIDVANDFLRALPLRNGRNFTPARIAQAANWTKTPASGMGKRRSSLKTPTKWDGRGPETVKRRVLDSASRLSRNTPVRLANP
jgi:hypothetical protein